jgi:hypothetical protein
MKRGSIKFRLPMLDHPLLALNQNWLERLRGRGDLGQAGR